MKALSAIEIGEEVVVKEVNSKEDTKRRFLDLGIVTGTKIKALYRSPCNDPTAYLIKGTVIALRKQDCSDILVD